MLGRVADLGTDFFYFVARVLQTNGSDVARTEGAYETRFLAKRSRSSGRNTDSAENLARPRGDSA
jgi:hypothetical protein